MIIETRQEASRWPYEIKMRAREHFLRGLSSQAISDELGRQDAETARMVTEKAGLPVPSPARRVPPSVVRFWSHRGRWSAELRRARNAIEREQVDRIRREVAREASAFWRTLIELEAGLRPYFIRPTVDSEGRPVVDENGAPVMVPRGPGDWPIENPVQAVNAMLAVLGAKQRYLALVSKMLGDSLPAIGPGTLAEGLEAAPRPVDRPVFELGPEPPSPKT
jgi:hypothetical protein